MSPGPDKGLPPPFSFTLDGCSPRGPDLSCTKPKGILPKHVPADGQGTLKTSLLGELLIDRSLSLKKMGEASGADGDEGPPDKPPTTSGTEALGTDAAPRLAGMAGAVPTAVVAGSPKILKSLEGPTTPWAPEGRALLGDVDPTRTVIH